MMARLRSGIAGPLNLACLLGALFAFPFVARWVHAFSFATISAGSERHTPAFLKFCLAVFLFEWSCFLIAWIGIRQYNKVSPGQLVGGKWDRPRAVLLDTVIGLLTLIAMLLCLGILQRLLASFEHDTQAFQAMIPHNIPESLGFLAIALTAGFVEEFVFRGYLQAQLTAICGSRFLGSLIQIMLFMLVHYYQGLIRMVLTGVLGLVFTVVALWRKNLRPGMIAHGLGDSLSAIMFLAQRL
jgi:membrane protease YdiL (CAAX protease family)